MTKSLKGPKEPKVGNAKGLNFLWSHPRVWKINDAPDISAKETQGEDSDEKPFEEERDLVSENYDLKQKLFLSKFGLERFGLNDDIFFYTGFQSYRALMAFWNFIKPWSESLMSWNTAHKKWKKAPQTMLIHFFFSKDRRNKEIEREIKPIDQLWLFLTRVRFGLFEPKFANIHENLYLTRLLLAENQTPITPIYLTNPLNEGKTLKNFEFNHHNIYHPFCMN